MKRKDKVLIKVKIQNENFDVSKEMKKLQTNETGAIVNFVGIVRGKDEKTNEDIFSMTLEHYPGMTELEIESIVMNSTTRWEISAVTVIHRIGKLFSSDQIVFVGVASKHRQNAFDACNYIMDWLKTKAPFWKIEEGSKEKKWVEFNSSDYNATKKWEQK
jgi:molybdopterin synthase catalytic subunit